MPEWKVGDRFVTIADDEGFRSGVTGVVTTLPGDMDGDDLEIQPGSLGVYFDAYPYDPPTEGVTLANWHVAAEHLQRTSRKGKPPKITVAEHERVVAEHVAAARDEVRKVASDAADVRGAAQVRREVKYVEAGLIPIEVLTRGLVQPQVTRNGDLSGRNETSVSLTFVGKLDDAVMAALKRITGEF